MAQTSAPRNLPSQNAQSAPGGLTPEARAKGQAVRAASIPPDEREKIARTEQLRAALKDEKDEAKRKTLRDELRANETARKQLAFYRKASIVMEACKDAAREIELLADYNNYIGTDAQRRKLASMFLTMFTTEAKTGAIDALMRPIPSKDEANDEETDDKAGARLAAVSAMRSILG